MSASSTCDGFESADPVYLADLGASAIGPDPDPHPAPAICWLCADCYPHLDAHPPVGTPPTAGPTQSADYVCGRAKRQGERCRSPVGQPWAPCGFHQFASIIPNEDADLWDTSPPDAPPREATATRRPAANAPGPPDSWDDVDLEHDTGLEHGVDLLAAEE